MNRNQRTAIKQLQHDFSAGGRGIGDPAENPCGGTMGDLRATRSTVEQRLDFMSEIVASHSKLLAAAVPGFISAAGFRSTSETPVYREDRSMHNTRPAPGFLL